MQAMFTPTADQVQAAFVALGLNRAERYQRVAQLVTEGTARTTFPAACGALDRLVVRMACSRRRRPFGRNVTGRA